MKSCKLTRLSMPPVRSPCSRTADRDLAHSAGVRIGRNGGLTPMVRSINARPANLQP
ncbi:hypothetical protein GGQ85_001839 [Nitrobacter vulgaris]|nr:hypothetical protein [Nitrobacter vulgaris]